MSIPQVLKITALLWPRNVPSAFHPLPPSQEVGLWLGHLFSEGGGKLWNVADFEKKRKSWLQFGAIWRLLQKKKIITFNRARLLKTLSGALLCQAEQFQKCLGTKELKSIEHIQALWLHLLLKCERLSVLWGFKGPVALPGTAKGSPGSVGVGGAQQGIADHRQQPGLDSYIWQCLRRENLQRTPVSSPEPNWRQLPGSKISSDRENAPGNGSLQLIWYVRIKGDVRRVTRNPCGPVRGWEEACVVQHNWSLLWPLPRVPDWQAVSKIHLESVVPSFHSLLN